MGLAPGLTTEDNLGLKAYRRPPFSNGPWLRAAAFKERGAELIDEYDIRGVRPGLPIRLLSGGNLQKALIAREVTAGTQGPHRPIAHQGARRRRHGSGTRPRPHRA